MGEVRDGRGWLGPWITALVVTAALVGLMLVAYRLVPTWWSAGAGTTGAKEALQELWDKPTRETFEMKGASPERLAQEITRRYGVPFRLEVTETEHADLVADGVTFFEALDYLAAATGLFLAGVPAREEERAHGREPPLALVRKGRRSVEPTPVEYIGPSRLSVQGVVARTARVFTVEGPRVGVDSQFAAWSDLEEEDRLRVVFKWIVEPGFESAVLVRLKLMARDDTGKTMRALPRYAFDPPDRICRELPLRANGYFQVDLSPPAIEARAIRTLAGSMLVAFPVERSEIEFGPNDAGATKRLGGCVVTLVKTEGTIGRFAFEGLPCREIANADPVDQIEIVACGANGGVVDCSKCGGSVSGTWATWWKEWNEPPARIVLKAITRVVLREAPFAFADVPLPE